MYETIKNLSKPPNFKLLLCMINFHLWTKMAASVVTEGHSRSLQVAQHNRDTVVKNSKKMAILLFFGRKTLKLLYFSSKLLYEIPKVIRIWSKSSILSSGFTPLEITQLILIIMTLKWTPTWRWVGHEGCSSNLRNWSK